MSGEHLPEPQTCKVNQYYGPGFRVVHADGAWFSVLDRPNMHLMFFATRLPLPEQLTHNVLPGNKLGDEVLAERIVPREGVDREFQVDVVISLSAARDLAQSLKEFVDKVEGTA